MEEERGAHAHDDEEKVGAHAHADEEKVGIHDGVVEEDDHDGVAEATDHHGGFDNAHNVLCGPVEEVDVHTTELHHSGDDAED